MRNKLILTIFTFLTLIAGSPAMALEEPEYETILQIADIEFRRYEPYIVAEVSAEGANPDREAFGVLAGYIFGDNQSGEEMSMTAPVETRGNDYAFVMESKYSMSSLPQPNDPRINLRSKPARTVAVLRFSGRWTEKNFAKHEERLLDALEELDIDVIGTTELARYNSPFKPWFLRRNEVLIAVEHDAVESRIAVASEAPARL